MVLATEMISQKQVTNRRSWLTTDSLARGIAAAQLFVQYFALSTRHVRLGSAWRNRRRAVPGQLVVPLRIVLQIVHVIDVNH